MKLSDGICDALFAIPTRKKMDKNQQRLGDFFGSFLSSFLSPSSFISFLLESEIRKLMFKLSISFDLSTLSLFWIPLTVKNYGSSQDRLSIGWNISAVPLQLEKCVIFLECKTFYVADIV